jgi:hypothetical protein
MTSSYRAFGAEREHHEGMNGAACVCEPTLLQPRKEITYCFGYSFRLMKNGTIAVRCHWTYG